MSSAMNVFKREMIDFGVEVIKHPRKGTPEPRTIVLSDEEPMELRWVGKGGERKVLALSDIVGWGIGRNELQDETESPYPSAVFERTGQPENAQRYLSLKLRDGLPHGRETLDIEFATTEHCDLFVMVLKRLLNI